MLNEDSQTLEQSDLERLNEIILSYEIYKWNGYYKSDSLIYDGHSFSLYVRYSDGATIEASGYMEYPENYDSASERLMGYLRYLTIFRV